MLINKVHDIVCVPVMSSVSLLSSPFLCHQTETSILLEYLVFYTYIALSYYG